MASTQHDVQYAILMLFGLLTFVAVQEEAKDAFKELLTSVGCASDWTWEQAMRVIISDHRYTHSMLWLHDWCFYKVLIGIQKA